MCAHPTVKGAPVKLSEPHRFNIPGQSRMLANQLAPSGGGWGVGGDKALLLTLLRWAGLCFPAFLSAPFWKFCCLAR